MATYTDSAKSLDILINSLETKYQNAIRDALAVISSSYTLDQIATLIENGQLEQAISDIMSAQIGHFASVVNNGYVLAGEIFIGGLPKLPKFAISFDQVNERAVAAMRENRLRLIREFTQEQAEVTRNVLIEGIRGGLNPREQARNFRGNIGLTRRQQMAVQRYREALERGSTSALGRELRDRRFDSTVRNAKEKPLTKEQIDRMVQRYRERYIKYRSEVIARTEALRSVNQGAREGALQVVDQGIINAEEIDREWHSAHDSRVRHSHTRLNGMHRGLHETFPGDAGPILYPGDPNAPASETIHCRCVVLTTLNF